MKRMMSILLMLMLLATPVAYASDLNNSSTTQAFPVSMVVSFTISTVPNGWLECDGSAISRVTYKNLYDVLGVTFGNGDTTTTFNLPDLRGCFLRGQDNGASVDPDAASRTDRGDGTGGDNVGSKQANATKRPNSSFTSNSTGSHTHNMYHCWSTGSYSSNSIKAVHPSNSGQYRWDNWANSSAGSHSHSITGGGDSETRPVNVYVRYYIKY